MGSKYRIVISRSISKMELFDQMPSSLTLEDFWLTLLCHGGSLVYRVAVGIVNSGWLLKNFPAFKWYPRTLIKTLLTVSANLSLPFLHKKR